MVPPFPSIYSILLFEPLRIPRRSGGLDMESDERPGYRFFMFVWSFFSSGQGEKCEIGPETKPACALPCDVCQIPCMPLLRPLSLLHVSSLLHHLSEFISSFFLSLLFTSAPSHLAPLCRGDVIVYRSSFPDILQRGGRVTSSIRTLLCGCSRPSAL